MIPSLFITGPGTGEGKTYVTRALAAALRVRAARVAALKPIETGVEPDPLDALALARAAGRPELALGPDLYRARAPLAPFAAELEGSAPALDLSRITQRIQTLAADADVILVEGAGGLLVPLDSKHDLVDLAVRLGFPLLLVARDQLGVLSHVLTCVESARARALRVAAVILSRHSDAPDPSTRTNQRILEQRLCCPVHVFPPCGDASDAALASQAEALRLPDRLGLV